jgi:hypothetical protein
MVERIAKASKVPRWMRILRYSQEDRECGYMQVKICRKPAM